MKTSYISGSTPIETNADRKAERVRQATAHRFCETAIRKVPNGYIVSPRGGPGYVFNHVQDAIDFVVRGMDGKCDL